MARITVEDCLTKETNRFGLVQLAAKRTKQLLHGAKMLIADNRGNKSVVTALREIAAGQVRFMSEEDIRKAEEQALLEQEAREEAAAAAPAQTAADSIFKIDPSTLPKRALDEDDDDDDDDDEMLADDDDDDDDDEEGEEKKPSPLNGNGSNSGNGTSSGGSGEGGESQ